MIFTQNEKWNININFHYFAFSGDAEFYIQHVCLSVPSLISKTMSFLFMLRLALAQQS